MSTFPDIQTGSLYLDNLMRLRHSETVKIEHNSNYTVKRCPKNTAYILNAISDH